MRLETIGNGDSLALSRRLIELVEHFYCRLPVDTGVRNADTVLEVSRARGWYVLSPSVDMRLDHHASDMFSLGIGGRGCKLLGDGVDDKRLVVVILQGVAVYENHAALGSFFLLGHGKHTYGCSRS